MKRNRYLHGWKGYIQCVYGTYEMEGPWRWVQPCTLAQAKRALRNVQKQKQKDYRIYKLVAVR